ncbi:MAG: pyridoxal 5'-phosphate synthase glutaminase subunit PdxT [Actinomycetota bacterium]
MKIGVLALQGDFEAHARAVRSVDAEPIEVRTSLELASCDALIIPGGESTTIRKLAVAYGLLEPLRERAHDGLPIFGTCAGMIACARTIVDGDEPIVPIVDIDVRRNAYGRQVQSFEADVDVAGIGEMRAVFIRAPRVERVGASVDVMARVGDDPVLCRSGQVWVAAFHPELTDDLRIHQRFIEEL